jgi:dimethylargininase
LVYSRSTTPLKTSTTTQSNPRIIMFGKAISRVLFGGESSMIYRRNYSTTFRRAIVRNPAANFANGLTTIDLGAPDLKTVLTQHALYCEALEKCGLCLTRLPSAEAFPDSAFVEDVAVLRAKRAILTNPGAPSRKGEVALMRDTLAKEYDLLDQIADPGTLDGGDICELDDHVLIGVSLRTNHEGAQQLAKWLKTQGVTSAFIDIRQTPGILHLKSGISYVGNNRIVVIEALAGLPELRNFELIVTDPSEDYAANLIRVNDYVLIASGFPKLQAKLESLGYSVLPIDMSEYQKMDGGLSCLSLRF